MGRGGTSDYSNQVLLYILLCSASDLGQVGNTLTKVSVASGWLENRETEVKFFSTDDVDGPFDIVIPEKLMPVMKCLRCKKSGQIREGPVPKEQLGDSIQMILLCGLEIFFEIIWVNINVLQLLQCESFRPRWVAEAISKLLVHHSCDW